MSESPSKRPRMDSSPQDKPSRMPYSRNKPGNRPIKAPESEPAPSGSIPAMFQSFRTELDEHHDRRERVIKNSRDITANSKKAIFTLQRQYIISFDVPTTNWHRASSLGSPLPPAILQDIEGKEKTIAGLLQAIHPADLSKVNAWRYQRQISGGMQEFMEAAIFKHYLITGRLLSHEEASKAVQDLLAVKLDKSQELKAEDQESMAQPESVPMLLTEEDYLLGIFDATGELMRWGITNLRSSQGSGSNLIQDMRSLRLALENLRTQGSGYHFDVSKKMEVMKTCVEKVENAVYGMVVRGSERPSGWVPEDSGAGRPREEVESY